MSSAYQDAASHREIHMRVLSSVAALSLGLVMSTSALAVTGEEAQLIDTINKTRDRLR